MGVASELFVGQLGEEALDLIDPGSTLGREVHVDSWPSQ
jgi:hypothetical protein